jgi:nicotinate-nucleotide adenylyltransferase
MRLGILGGTFDPVHNGHISIAKHVKEEFALDMIFLMVAASPPHKPSGCADADLRFSMVKLACEDIDGIYASDMELERSGKSYTSDTIERVSKLYPGAEIFFITGMDMLLDMPGWHDPGTIFDLSTVIGVVRDSSRSGLLSAASLLRSEFGAKVLLSDMQPFDISSTNIRHKIYNASAVRSQLPDGVAMFIYKSMLYLPDGFVSKQKSLYRQLEWNRYVHSLGTALEATELADKYGVDGIKARTAGLLHDCARFDLSRQLDYAEKCGLKCYNGDIPDLLHAELGAEIAKAEYGIMDDEIIQSIRYHTAGCLGMSTLDRIIYLADKIEPSRSYDGIDQIRLAAYQDLDYAVAMAMKQSISYTLKKGGKLYKGTEDALKYILNETERRY